MNLSRRGLGRLAAGLTLPLLAGCGDGGHWHAIDVSGSSPSLLFTLSRAPDGKRVSEADYRGEIVLLYFGYTYCPDVCPTTLTNVADILQSLGAGAQHVRVLFVTVDPNRDTLPVLASYAKAFSPRIEGLRGTPDELAALARRYRVEYSVSPATRDHPYEVTHSSAIYVFDRTGAAKLIIASLATTMPDVPGVTADLKRLVAQEYSPGPIERLLNFV